MELLKVLWEMRRGVSECWWLGTTCAVNWDAWSAVGTVSAVFVAVLAPSIQRAFSRRKANGLFALAYRADVINAQLRLENIRRDYPMRERDGARWAVETLLANEGPHRDGFLERAKWLDVLSRREVDLTKWPAVDLGLAAKVVVGIESVRHFQVGAVVLADPADDRDWGRMLDSVAEVLDQAIVDIEVAEVALRQAVNKLPRKKLR